MAGMTPGLEAADFMLLPRFGVYARLVRSGHPLGWMSGDTLPPSQPTTDAAELRAASAERYGRLASEVEAETARAVSHQSKDKAARDAHEPIGRRQKESS
jgi:hypothetical protein